MTAMVSGGEFHFMPLVSAHWERAHCTRHTRENISLHVRMIIIGPVALESSGEIVIGVIENRDP